MDDKNKTWRALALAGLTICAVLIGVVIALIRHIAVAAEPIEYYEAELIVRPQTFMTIMEDMLFIPASLPDGMEELSLNYYGAEDDAYFAARYVDGAGGWLETGVDINEVKDGYTLQDSKEINGVLVDTYTGDDGSTMLVYQVDITLFYVRGSLSEADLSNLMSEYVDFINNNRLI